MLIATRALKVYGKLRVKRTLVVYVAYDARGRGSMLGFSRDEKGIDRTSWDFFVMRTPKHTYLNVTPRETVSRKQLQLSRGKAYVFFEYHFSWFGELVLSPVGGAAFSQAVERKRLHGKNEFLATTISRENPQRILELLETSKPKDVFMATIRARKIGRP
ncbi:MAG: hypothetical protein DMF45_09055 [Verrucomicrobia bacterium]|nr:MAG: hypothetical protein DMF45_09055 [Verrucomicrobiota bacterium]